MKLDLATTDGTDRTLRRIADDIIGCTLCDSRRIKVGHVQLRERGRGRLGMVVGLQPGGTEMQTGAAFSGPAGKRLMEWLVQAGVGTSREEILEQLYLTSLAKCLCDKPDFKAVVRNCRPFLARQIAAVRPRVFITLGAEPLKQLFELESLDYWIGRPFREQEIRASLFPLLPASCQVVALPHPSPLSRWLNTSQNRRKLDLALSQLGKLCRNAPHA